MSVPWHQDVGVADDDQASSAGLSLLDTGALPVEELARLAMREAWRPRAIYQAHKWFARRFGSAFRALLTGAALPSGSDFWPTYYAGADWRGKIVLDPFVGGGTSVIEALRLGADVIGVDVDAVACAITRFETRAAATPDLEPAIERLRRRVGDRLAPYSLTTLPDGTTRTVLHFFWVQIVTCGGCAHPVEAHPHYQLAYEAEGKRQWVFCPDCHAVQELDRKRKTLHCASCGRRATIQAGTVKHGRLTCPRCATQERLIDAAGREGPPTWYLFALETLEQEPRGRTVPLTQRKFRSATAADRALFAAAEAALAARADAEGRLPAIPERRIPVAGRADDRLPRYGYRRYRELFNARQLLHLSLLAEAIGEEEDGAVREALALAFSDHLTTNCMLTHYAFGWRRLAPLFTIRAFRHVPRPVEINPWLEGTGRGTFPNAVRAVTQAIAFDRTPKEPTLEGGFRQVSRRPAPIDGIAHGHAGLILHRSSEDLAGIADGTVDLVLTDPPYFDNIAYSELSDFFLPWLEILGLAAEAGADGVTGFQGNLAAKGRKKDALAPFRTALAACFREVARTLKPEGRLVFTYQHHTAGAWSALAGALAGAGLRPVQVFPLLGDGQLGLHGHAGSIRWDAVFVAVPDPQAAAPVALSLSSPACVAATAHRDRWARRLAPGAIGFNAADRRNFGRACLVAAALGLFPGDTNDHTARPLDDVLAEEEVLPPLVSPLEIVLCHD